MKFYLTFLLLCGMSLSSIQAQNSPLGGLPPVPNLGSGSSRSDEGMAERIRKKRKATDDAQKRELIARQEARKSGAAKGKDKVSRRVGSVEQGEPPAQAPRRMGGAPGQLVAPEDSVTPSGSRLKPFGVDDFWQEELVQEERIIELPPLPDFRTPQQKTRMERILEARVAKSEARHEAIVAQEEAKEKAANQMMIKKVPLDPSTALVQVSRQKAMYGYNGAPINPETPTGKQLRAFNQGSRYVQDNQLVYTGSVPTRAQTRWLDRGVNPTAYPGDNDGKWEWKNPFSAGGANQDLEMTPLGGGTGIQGDVSAAEAVDDTPLVSSLRGIRVVSGTRAVTKTGLGGISGIVADGVTLPEKANDALAAYLGTSLSLGSLNELVRDVVVAYRESDMPVIDVLVPEQEVTTGVLQLVIIEGRVGDVLVEGVEGTTAELLASQVRLSRGEVIKESTLLDDLNWMNKHPFRRVDLVYSPGADYGTTDIVLRAEQLKALSGYVSVDNSGNEILGQERFTAGASWAGPLFFSEENLLSYQFTTNFESEADLVGHSVVFASYLPWRHQLTVLGAYVESEAMFDIDGQELVTGGLNQQLSGRYAIPMKSLGKWTHEFEVGMDFKSSNSALDFNTLEVFDSTSEIVQFSIGYNATARDSSGQWSLDSELVLSPGDITRKGTDEIYGEQRGLATSDYTYARVMAERQQSLPKQWQLIGRVQAQTSNTNLLATETLGAGGYDSVRGFEQRIARGDNGFIGTLELRTPPVSPARWLGFYNARDAAVALVFLDYGALSSADKLPNEENLKLGSAGAGIRYQLDDNVSVRLDYGTQIVEEGFDDGESGRFHVGARATF